MREVTLVFFRHGEIERPVLKVTDSPDQVLIVIRSEPNEHLTLHRESDGTVLLTHWSEDKPAGTWDAANVEVARSLGYRDPERHAHYYAHRPLFPVQGMDGHELGGRRIDLEAATDKAKYAAPQRIVVDAPARTFMLTFHLATPEQPYSSPDDPHVATSFGDLYFRPRFDF
jgi:hypothetical protein